MEEIKKMKYTKEHIEDILATGIYLGIKYYVKTYGTHPCAYLEVDYNTYIDTDFIDNIEVHGGITYKNDELRLTNTIKIYGYYIGWDYAHCGDYNGFFINEPKEMYMKKYRTEEIIKDCKKVIEQICKYNIKQEIEKNRKSNRDIILEE